LFLSKSAATVWLDISEIALLAFGAILVLGLVGEYSDSPRWTKRVKLFAGLVILGVAGELLADGGVFLFSRRLQVISDSEIADAQLAASQAQERAAKADLARVQLEERMAWRHLSTVQRDALCMTLPPRFTNLILVLSSPQDPEAWQYANEFGTAIREFGISQGFGASGHLGTQAWSQVVFGVRLRIGRNGNYDANFAERLALAKRLREALERSGVEIAGLSIEDGAFSLIELYVGPRFPPQTENTTRADKKQ
jgi:hypothetical protein